jgi:hypothetical protein
MASNSRIMAIKMIKYVSLQLDEASNVSDNVKLLPYVHYTGLKDMEEKFLFLSVT